MSSPLLKAQRPDLFAQLDLVRNEGVDLAALTCGSQKPLWWRCAASGQVWQATAKNRCGTPSARSPFELNKRLAVGFNDVRTVRPDLAAQWAETNHDAPEHTLISSKTPVEWVCPASGLRWSESPSSRAKKPTADSPAQQGRVVVAGFNDLASAVPAVVDAWDSRNDTSPDGVLARSSRAVYLRDPATGATWQDTPRAITARAAITPHKLVTGLNDLATLHPELAAQMDPTLDPRTYPAQSNEKVLWVCPETGKTWEAIIANRVKTGTRSPFQTNRRVATGINDLATARPGLAAQVVSHHDPSTLALKSNVEVNWECPVYGIRWKESVASRTSRDTDDSPYVRGARAVPGVNDLFTVHPALRVLWDAENTTDPSTLLPRSHREVRWHCGEGHLWTARVADITRVDGKATGCPQCAAQSAASSVEDEVRRFIESMGVEVSRQDSTVLVGRRVDLFLPEHNLVVEVYGTYWHREQFVGRTSHRDRAAAVHASGARFLVVWEDDWEYRRDIVKSHIAHLLGKSTGRVYARSTEVRELKYLDVKGFLDTYHIQGAGSRSAKFFGLVHGDEIVAVSAWSRSGDALTLHRYATSQRVVGGMGRLLARANTHARVRGLSKIVTFSDNEVSRGDMYRKLGFTMTGELAPDYRYVVGSRRVHKSAYRLTRFRTDPDLQWCEGATERELADLNGIARAWDSGKRRWEIAVA